jgi:thiamine transport system permease protein
MDQHLDRSGQVRTAVQGPKATALLAALPTLFLGYFFVWPLVAVLGEGLTSGGDFDATPIIDALRSGDIRGVVWFTFWQATASTALTLVLGLPAAYMLARYRFPGRRLIRAAVTIPFVLPTVVVGIAFIALLGPDGPLGIDLRRTIWVILIAHVFFNYAVVVRTVGSFWERIDPTLEEAARSLGATRWQAFREVTLPLLRPAIASAASIVFLFTFTSFGVILILGDLRLSTLEVEIWRQAVGLLDRPTAAALAVLQLVGVGLLLIAYSRYQEKRAVQMSIASVKATAQRPTGWKARSFVGLNLGVMAVLLGSPMAVLVMRSLRPAGRFGLDYYRGLGDLPGESVLFVPPTEAIANSLRFALAATAIALVIGLLAATVVAYRRGPVARGFDALLMLPLGTSAVTVGFGFLIALGAPVDLRASPWLIPIAHALIAVPFVVRTAAPLMRSVRHRLREAAAVLGAAPTRVWREIDLPIVRRATLVGAGFAFAVSLGEFGATAFIVRPDAPTIPIAIYRLFAQPGAATFGRAMALSAILMLLTAFAIFMIERFRAGEGADF